MTDTNAAGHPVAPQGPVIAGNPPPASAGQPNSGAANAAPHADPAIDALEEGQARVGQLLAVLRDSTTGIQDTTPVKAASFENQLALVRLGMATSLFYALRTKHAPTAAHSLRAALICSAWASRLELEERMRDRIEVAALLHDLGKIGIPDRILRKPGKLSVDEQLMMDCCPELACEILRGCTGDQELLEIITYSQAWYDSRRQGEGPRGDALPLGARMLAIANAFDAMTTDNVYRTAMSRERATQELNAGSGTQFDPELVADFSRLLQQQPEILQGVVVDRWLQRLQQDSGDGLWGVSPKSSVPADSTSSRRDNLFYQQLIGNLNDGVAFTDTEGTITQWNQVMGKLTSIAADAIVGQTWSSECVRLRERDETRPPNSCVVRECLRTRARVSRAMILENPGGAATPVHVQVTPVLGSTPGTHGTVVIVRDMTHQHDLEERLETLHHQNTLDPLTGVANRAHLDTTIRNMAADASERGSTFSLIICDIDHFKRVNDVHGHPAGDEALINFAAILSGHSREGDLVARYGGEEFLLLAAACDNSTATRRAEAIRTTLERTPLPSLNGQAVTASFGVTEFQPGDTAETVVARADRALLKAKYNGRNRVVQMGSGQAASPPANATRRGWLSWFDSGSAPQTECTIRTPVPVDLAIEKLRGFIADHQAEIINVSENQVSLRLNVTYSTRGRRRVDQQISLQAKLTLSEGKQSDGAEATRVHLALQPIRNRDRRNRDLGDCVKQIVASLNSYVMGEIVADD